MSESENRIPNNGLTKVFIAHLTMTNEPGHRALRSWGGPLGTEASWCRRQETRWVNREISDLKHSGGRKVRSVTCVAWIIWGVDFGYGSSVVVNKEPGNRRLRDCWVGGSGVQEAWHGNKQEEWRRNGQKTNEGENQNCNINVMTPLNIPCRRF